MLKNKQTYHNLAKALVFLNLYDALCTSIWITLGLAIEANPLMRILIEQNLVLFLSVKLLLVNLGIWLVWRNIENIYARLSVLICFIAYAAVCIFHTAVSIFYLSSLFIT